VEYHTSKGKQKCTFLRHCASNVHDDQLRRFDPRQPIQKSSRTLPLVTGVASITLLVLSRSCYYANGRDCSYTSITQSLNNNADGTQPSKAYEPEAAGDCALCNIGEMYRDVELTSHCIQH